MAPPVYPGAFFFDGNKKVTVKKAVFSDVGFPEMCENGTIIQHKENEYLVKVQNGCITLFEYTL